MRPNKFFLAIALAALFCAPLASSAEVSCGGEKVGTVDFPISCNGAAEIQFDRGVALLHSFWYEQALKAFTAFTKADPGCAMGYWGIAMSLWHPLRPRPNEDAARGQGAVEKAEALIHPETGRLHTSFNQAVTATGWLSSSEPNLQNIPIRTPLGASIRKAFAPAAGFLIMVADYSQIDLRVLAHLSKDLAFLEAFRAGRDIHRETAAQIFGVKLSQVSSEMRATAKTVNYATIYGQGAPSLAHQLGISEEEAQRFIDGYFLRFPAIRSYFDDQIEQAEKEGYVETIFGRRRYVPELRSKSPGIRNFGRRVAQNTPIQGSAADIIKLAMIRIHQHLSPEGGKSRMLLQIHDELLFEVWEGELEALRELVHREMEKVVELEVPLLAQIGVGKSWYYAKNGK